MCGFVGIFGFTEPLESARSRALEMAKTVRHRGPDWSGIYSSECAILAHERLSIVDVEHGAQPLLDVTAGRALAVNGEIYNHVALRDALKLPHVWRTKSDCEIILYLYDEYGSALCNMLSGIFAFALFDERSGDFFVARDHIGIVPLYIGWGSDGATYVASEMKALDRVCETIREFPPGHYYSGKAGQFVKWYDPQWAHTLPTKKVSLHELRTSLEAAVKQQMMCDVPYGVLISGGLELFPHRGARGTPPLQADRVWRDRRSMVAKTTLVLRRPGKLT